jgi:hypothetical protein
MLETYRLNFISTNRLKKTAHKSFPTLHIIGNKILTYLTNLLFRVSINDSQSGMWVFRKSILEKMDLQADGMAFKLFKAAEVPVPYRKRIGKQKLNTLMDGFKNALHLFNLRWYFATPIPSWAPIYTTVNVLENNRAPAFFNLRRIIIC